MFTSMHQLTGAISLALFLLLPSMAIAQERTKVCEARPGCGIFYRPTTTCTSAVIKWYGQCVNGFAEGKGITEVNGSMLDFIGMQRGQEVGVVLRRAPALGDGVFVGRRTPGQPFVSTFCDAMGSPQDGSESGRRLCAEALSEWGKAAFSTNYLQNIDQIISSTLSFAGIQDSSHEALWVVPDAGQAAGRTAGCGVVSLTSSEASGVVRFDLDQYIKGKGGVDAARAEVRARVEQLASSNAASNVGQGSMLRQLDEALRACQTK